MHLSFKSICNKEYKGVICDMTSSSNSSQSTRPTGRVLGKNYSSFLDFTRNYERTSGIFVPWIYCTHAGIQRGETPLDTNAGQLGPVISDIAYYFPRYFHKGYQYEVCFKYKNVQQKFEGIMFGSIYIAGY